MYVYILKCNDGTYYTGVTNNIHRRFQEHQTGCCPSCYTSTRRPLQLLYYELFSSPHEAIAAEKQIKKWSKKKKDALIRNDWNDLKLLSKKKWKK